MRLIQLRISDDLRQRVVETLEERDIGHSITDEVGSDDDHVLITIPLPVAAVEPVLEELRAVGVDESTTTVVLEAETVISDEFDELVDQYPEEVPTNERIAGEQRIAREELETRARDQVSSLPTYLTLTIVSAVVATAGLLLDSAATVVGSMVIAPLIGPSMAASIGTVLDDRELFRQGVTMQILGIVAAVLSAAIFGLIVRHLLLVPPGLEVLTLGEVSERSAPNFLFLAIAIGAGIAGILSLVTGISAVLVGVMIAVALIPPAAALGVGIAFGQFRLVLGAGVIVMVNVLSINLASLVTLWFEGYRPRSWFTAERVRSSMLKQVVILALAISLVSMFLLGVTYESYVAATTEEEIRIAVNEELVEQDVAMEVRELHVERAGLFPPLETDRVTITISVDPTAPTPQVADRLSDRIATVSDGDPAVEIEFVYVQHPSS